MTYPFLRLAFGLAFFLPDSQAPAQSLITGRQTTSLNGQWAVIVDPVEVGRTNWQSYFKDEKPDADTKFKEYAFVDNQYLNVPGDWNSQREKLLYYEGLIWYKKAFSVEKRSDKRYFLHFGAVNNHAVVYLNGTKLGEHEGGFTPFSVDVTDSLHVGPNMVIVAADNKRSANGIPAANYDWWNYGGITRDVELVETPIEFIDRYSVQLKPGSTNQVEGWVRLNGAAAGQPVTVSIPAMKLTMTAITNADGYARVSGWAKLLRLWSPDDPMLYDVQVRCPTDTVGDQIGFRKIAVSGPDILLNGKSVFLKGINLHEEIGARAGRAWSEADARQLLQQAKDLGCNFVRLAHYPHNEHIVRLADRLGLLVWSEIPLWQQINFNNPAVEALARQQLTEMIERDRNRASVIIWSVANETPVTTERTQFLQKLVTETRRLDSTRLVSAAFQLKNYAVNSVVINDPLGADLDVLAVNEYMGWYNPWQAAPAETVWTSIYNKPLIMTEFGAEALHGNHGDSHVAHSWSEEFQEAFYTKQFTMLAKIPFLRGTAPWVLADFRSPVRNLPGFQDGWNRKGLLSDKGLRKKAWYVIQRFYQRNDLLQPPGNVPVVKKK